MSLFSSQYECRIDVKGRMVLPAKIKSNLPDTSSNELMLRMGFEPSLILYPMMEYKRLYSKIGALSDFNLEHRKLKRSFFSAITNVDFDGNGRINIPNVFLRYAQLEKEAIVIGIGNSVEIWNPDLYQKYMINDQEEFSQLAQKYLDEP
ncbi:MAG: division/cell wall cluster transcriptional repressor MraZ [Bacteroidetes bacterium]|nr:division/cell wall cluster transcriptional repressor MraZ [Bacteroidota bacterium]MDA1121078.1 division/cell wall cluster transcriptional repressor MraZ [Bacteroidota bacterium]